MELTGSPSAGGAAPQTIWGKLLTSTPVVMTVLATLLAGLSNSEMSRAQYDRALAAQQQSKVGDQWAFFQAKRLRGATLRANLQLLHATAEVGPLDQLALSRVAEGTLPAAHLPAALGALAVGQLPVFAPRAVIGPPLRAALDALAAGDPDAEVVRLLQPVPPAALQAVVHDAHADARAFEALVAPVTLAVEQLAQRLAAAPDANPPVRRRDFTAAQMRYDAARYDAEARHNRVLAELYELQVRLSNHSAERHHLRSLRFFYGMLGAQAAVILASLALAVQKRNLLWGLAAVTGLAALAFGIYVYLWI
jgi:hypothetical protein